MKIAIGVISLFLMICHEVMTQVNEFQYDYVPIKSYLSVPQSDIVITGVAIDQNDLVWLSTLNGIFRYDGNSFNPMFRGITAEIMPYVSTANKLFVRPNGDLWIVNNRKGVVEIDPLQAKTQTLARPESAKLNKAAFTYMWFESDSIAWFVTSDYGFHKLDLSSRQWVQNIVLDDRSGGHTDLVLGYHLTDPNHPSYSVISSREQLYHVNRDNGTVDIYVYPKENRYYREMWLVPIHFFQDQLLVGTTFDGGLMRMNWGEKQWTSTMEVEPFKTPNHSHIFAFKTINDTTVLIGQRGGARLGMYINGKSTLHYAIEEVNVPYSALNNTLQFLNLSDSSTIAISHTGMTRMTRTRSRFTFFSVLPPGSRKNNWQRSFYPLGDHKFLIGTLNGDGLMTVDWKNRTTSYIPYKSSPGMLNFDVTMWALERIDDDQYLIGSSEGVLLANIATEKIIAHPTFEKHPVLAKSVIKYLKRQDDYYWVCTDVNGVFQYDLHSDSIRVFADFPEYEVRKILRIGGYDWIGSSKGLDIHDYRSDEWVDEVPPELDISIKSLLQIKDTVWISTEERGLWAVEIKDDLPINPVQYYNQELVRANFLRDILWDTSANTLWLNTAGGYSKFYLNQKSFVNYTLDDGIGFVGKHNAIMRWLPDGGIMNGANRYFQYFYPEQLEKSAISPTPYLKEVIVQGENVGLMALNAQSIRLNPLADDISFRMGGVNYNRNPINYFSYRLIGLNEQWSDWSANDFVNYTNLKPQEYKFEFKVANKLFDTTGHYSKVIQIPKTWYETLWFKTLVALVIGVIAWLLFKARNDQRLREIKLKEEYQTEINELQMNALQLQMNPHFVFNSINSINYYIIKNDRDKASNYLVKFSRLIRMILENSKQKLISLEQELEAIRIYLEIEQVRFEGKFDFEIHVDSSVHLSSTQIPPMIIQPYVENAIWHGLMHKAGDGHLTISISNEDDHVKCVIEDDGIGREAAEKIVAAKGLRKKSLGTKITNNRLKYVEKVYGIKTNVEIVDLKHMDQTTAGTRVVIKTPIIKNIES